VNKILEKGYIRPSFSPYTAPVLVVKKPERGLRIYIDYRALNALTIKNRNAPSFIRDILSRLCKIKIYTKFDIIVAFNKIRIKKGNKVKTAFLTRFDLYEYLVISFNLYNVSGTFQAYINGILRQYLDNFCTAYLNDIFIYNNIKKEYKRHVRAVLERL
jgi:hypothetical protein